MTTSDARKRTRSAADDLAAETRAAGGQARSAVREAMDKVPDLVEGARSGAEQVTDHMPQALELARTGASSTAASLQTLPDPTLRLLAAFSVGLAVGLYLGGAPRLVTLAAAAPALIVAAVALGRPDRMSERRARLPAA